MRNKTKKLILIFNVAINVGLGIIVFQISNLIHRYNRLVVWHEENQYYSQFNIKMQNAILFAWIIWGVLFLLSIILLVLELRKKS